MDSDNTHYYQYPFYLLPDVKSATQTSKVDKYVFLPYAQALSNTGEHPDTLEWTDLLTSSDSAYIKTDVANIRSVEKEATDQSGQFTLAANVTDNETGADITIVGSSPGIHQRCGFRRCRTESCTVQRHFQWYIRCRIRSFY